MPNDIPFVRDDAHHLLPAMIACLVGFSALLFIVATTLTGTLAEQSRVVSGMVQVEIPQNKASAAHVEQITNALRATEGVEEVNVLSTVDMESLLRPWLGKDFALDTLPLPVLVDIKTAVRDGKTAVDLPALRRALETIEPSIAVEDRGPWASHMVNAVAAVQGLVLLVAALLLACVMGMIVLVAKTSLKLHFKTVRLLHLFGATDEYILRQFQRNSASLAARGALIGVAAAGVIFFFAVVVSHRWASPLLPELSFQWMHLMVLVGLPLFTALTAMLATRFTVQSMLHHMH